jgi:hypothetical protein
VDSYASLLVLLLANFFVIELVTDARWGAVASILLAVAALIVAISDPDAGEGLKTWHWILIAVCVAIAPVVLLVTSSSVLGVAYLVPVGLLVSATLPVTLSRIAHHKRVTAETISAPPAPTSSSGFSSRSSTSLSASSATRPSSPSPGRTKHPSTSISASSP